MSSGSPKFSRTVHMYYWMYPVVSKSPCHTSVVDDGATQVAVFLTLIYFSWSNFYFPCCFPITMHNHDLGLCHVNAQSKLLLIFKCWCHDISTSLSMIDYLRWGCTEQRLNLSKRVATEKYKLIMLAIVGSRIRALFEVSCGIGSKSQLVPRDWERSLETSLMVISSRPPVLSWVLKSWTSIFDIRR